MMSSSHALRTERLALEPLGSEHAARMLAYYERNREWLRPWEPARAASFYTLDGQRAAIDAARTDAAEERCVRFVAFEPGCDEIVGIINVQDIRRGAIHAAIPGYSVAASRAGRGYATELLDAIVRYAFDDLRLHRLEASYQPENRASARVLQKNGFVVEGVAREMLLLDGAWRDAVLVSKTNPSWTQLPAAT